MSNRRSESRDTAFWGPKIAFWPTFCSEKRWSKTRSTKTRILEKSPNGNFWVVGFFFWENFFLVKISTTRKIFLPKNLTLQNIRKIDFHGFSKIEFWTNHIPTARPLPFMIIKIFEISRKSVFRIFWVVQFFGRKNFLVVLIFSTKFFFQKKNPTTQHFSLSDFPKITVFVDRVLDYRFSKQKVGQNANFGLQNAVSRDSDRRFDIFYPLFHLVFPREVV